MGITLCFMFTTQGFVWKAEQLLEQNRLNSFREVNTVLHCSQGLVNSGIIKLVHRCSKGFGSRLSRMTGGNPYTGVDVSGRGSYPRRAEVIRR